MLLAGVALAALQHCSVHPCVCVVRVAELGIQSNPWSLMPSSALQPCSPSVPVQLYWHNSLRQEPSMARGDWELQRLALLLTGEVIDLYPCTDW